MEVGKIAKMVVLPPFLFFHPSLKPEIRFLNRTYAHSVAGFLLGVFAGVFLRISSGFVTLPSIDVSLIVGFTINVIGYN